MNRVEELRRVRSEIERLKEDERRLSIPILQNMMLIHNLYDVFCVTLKRQEPQADPKDTNSRKKFLYAILYLFSPATLVGDVMRHKLRECVSVVLGCTPTGVSRDYKTSIFFYATYSGFRESVLLIIKDMLDVMDKQEI